MTPSSAEKQRGPIVQKVSELEQVNPMDTYDQGLQQRQQGENAEMGPTQDEENDERLVLTPRDVENLLKDIAGGETEKQGQEPTKDFNEQVSERLEEYQQQLDVDNAL